METVDDWLGALAADTPTPGGGSAAALLVATGAALVEMVCGLTLWNEKFRDVEPLMAQSREKARGLRATAAALRLEDIGAYDAVIAAYRLPKGTTEETEARATAVQEALRGATEVPLRSVVAGVEVLDLAASIVESVNPNAISDVGAGALAARAGAEASALNVRINLLSIKDHTYTGMQKAALDALLARAATTTEQVGSAVRLAMGG